MYKGFAFTAVCALMMSSAAMADDMARALICATKLGSDLTARSNRAATMVSINECRLTYLKRTIGDCGQPDAISSQSIEIDLSALERVAAKYHEYGTEFVLSGRPDIRDLISHTIMQCDGDMHQRSSLSEASFTVPGIVPISVIENLRGYVEDFCR